MQVFLAIYKKNGILKTMTILIKNREMYDTFVKFLPELERDEVYFLSVSARNKYLTEDEREAYSLGRTEMFSRHIAYDREGIEYAIRKMQAELEVKTTRGGHPIPEKALVVYFNIHPSSMIKAYTLFKDQMNAHYDEIVKSLMMGSNPHYHPFLGMRTKLMNHIQKSYSRKEWVDIDIDAPDEETALQYSASIANPLFMHSINNVRIKTQGGIHLLVNRNDLNIKPMDVPLHKLIENIHKELKELDGECKFNDNAMVPLPGTNQAGKLVELLTI